jgi:hypothetical protein
LPRQKNNSTRREAYDQKNYGDNFERIFGSEKERKERADMVNIEKHKHQAARSKSAYIMKPIEEFKSNVDGSIISDRKQLADHNKRNGVTNSADYSESYMNNRRASIANAQERVDKTRRIEALKETMRTRNYEHR